MIQKLSKAREETIWGKYGNSKLIVKAQGQCQVTLIFSHLVTFQKSFFQHFYQYLWIEWVYSVHAPDIPHFKGLGMKKFQFEIRIWQKIIIKSQWQSQVTTKFYESDVIYLTDKVHKDSSSFRLDSNAIINKTQKNKCS